MLHSAKITDDLMYIGVNDRQTALFENQWPLPSGISYNSYLMLDEKTCLMDAVKITEVEGMLENLKNSLNGRPLDYIVVHHVEPDHSSSLDILMMLYPDAKLVGNKKTFSFLKNFYGIDQADHVLVDDGDVLDLGKHKLAFYKTPMVHWPESMVSFDTTDGILFSQDIFGSYGALEGPLFDDEISRWDHYSDEAVRYYVNIVSKYSMMALRALDKLSGLDIKMICPDHGPVWRSHPEEILKLYKTLASSKVDQSVTVIYGSMYGNTENMADCLVRELSIQGIKDVKLFDVSKTHFSYLEAECWKSRGIVLGSCSYDSDLFPPMQAFVNHLDKNKLKNHVLGIFGNYSWSGGGLKGLKAFAEKQKGMEVIEDPQPDALSGPKAEDFAQLKLLAEKVADAVKAHAEEDEKTSFKLFDK